MPLAPLASVVRARGFHAFYDRRQAQVVREVDDRARVRCGKGIFGYGGDERAARGYDVDKLRNLAKSVTLE